MFLCKIPKMISVVYEIRECDATNVMNYIE